MADRHALVFGASGIAGWGTLKAFSEDSSFASVIGTTLRKLDEIGIPNGKKIKLVSGIDLSKEKEEVRKMLRDIPGIENVTHVYWGAFLPNQNVEQRVALNTKMFKTTVTLVDELCPNLQFFLHQTGSMVCSSYSRSFGRDMQADCFLVLRSRIHV